MRRSKLFLTFIITFFFGIILCSLVLFGTQKPEWKGKIEYEIGVKVIKNPKEPLYGEITFELEEDLSIGREDDENYLFYRGVGLNVDSQENIYVLDSGSFRIQKFDKDGRYLQTIGRRGQGPGEFELPFKFFLDGKNYLYVYDSRKFKIFNNEGEFVKSIKLQSFILDFYVNPEGNIFVQSELRDEKGSKQVVGKIDEEGDIVGIIAEFPYVDLVVKQSGDVTYAFGVSRHAYIPELCFSAIHEKAFCYAHSSEYKMFKLDNNGKISLIFQKEESPQTISKKERDFILDRMKRTFEERGRNLPEEVFQEVRFPSHRPLFNHIMSDDKQRMYVRRLKSVLDKDEEIKFDIFGKDGHYLYKTRLPFTPRIIKNGFVYHVDSNEETGEIKIIKFKIKNWNQIEEGLI